jgi:hypothetical protein
MINPIPHTKRELLEELNGLCILINGEGLSVEDTNRLIQLEELEIKAELDTFKISNANPAYWLS